MRCSIKEAPSPAFAVPVSSGSKLLPSAPGAVASAASAKGWGKVQVEYQVTVDTLLVVESNYSVGMRYRSW